MLVVDSIGKIYQGAGGGVTALRDVSFTVSAGSFLAVRGPSGCGKSTLLHIVGAMDRPSSGSVRLAGRELSVLAPEELAAIRRRQIGFVFQSFNLLPTLTAAENVVLPLLLDGVCEREARRRAGDLLEQVKLIHRANHFPAELSGGEMQRVAVARAIAAQPQLLLADEPTGNLDSENGRRVMQLLAELNERLGLTVIVGTHSQEAAARARQSLYLRDGCLERLEGHEGLSATV